MTSKSQEQQCHQRREWKLQLHRGAAGGLLWALLSGQLPQTHGHSVRGRSSQPHPPEDKGHQEHSMHASAPAVPAKAGRATRQPHPHMSTAPGCPPNPWHSAHHCFHGLCSLDTLMCPSEAPLGCQAFSRKSRLPPSSRLHATGRASAAACLRVVWEGLRMPDGLRDTGHLLPLLGGAQSSSLQCQGPPCTWLTPAPTPSCGPAPSAPCSEAQGHTESQAQLVQPPAGSTPSMPVCPASARG